MDFVVSLDNSKMVAIESKNYLKRVELPSIKVFKNAYPDIDVLFSYKDAAKDVLSEKGVYPIFLI